MVTAKTVATVLLVAAAALVARTRVNTLTGYKTALKGPYYEDRKEGTGVREGLFGYAAGGKEGTIEAGTEEAQQPVCVLPGTEHVFWNARNTSTLLLDISLEPPLNSEAFFRTLAGLSQDQGGNLGKVNILQLLTTFVEGEVVIAAVPPPVWWVIERVLVPYFTIPVLGVQALPAIYTQH